MKYLVLKCANGVVVFQLFRSTLGQVVGAHCWTDGTTLESKTAGAFDPQRAMEGLIQKAVTLKGAFQSAFEVTL